MYYIMALNLSSGFNNIELCEYQVMLPPVNTKWDKVVIRSEKTIKNTTFVCVDYYKNYQCCKQHDE
jgi:hypothetical protein